MRHESRNVSKRSFRPAHRSEISSSDLTRALQTAEAISRVMEIPIQKIAELREKSYGEAEGKPQSWLDERFIFPPKIGNRMDHADGIAGIPRAVGTSLTVSTEPWIASLPAHALIRSSSHMDSR